LRDGYAEPSRSEIASRQDIITGKLGIFFGDNNTCQHGHKDDA